MKTLTLEDVVRVIGSIQPSGTEEKSLPLINGRRVKNKTYYIAGDSTKLANNGGEALLPSTVKTTGVTNFPSGGQLSKGVYFMCTGVRILFDIVVLTDPTLATWASTAPVAWKNGELIIGQDGQPSLFEAPGTDVTNFKASTGNDDDFREISGFLIQPQKQISIKALTAGAPVASTYKIELRGYEFVQA